MQDEDLRQANQSPSLVDLAERARRPIKQLWHPWSLPTAGLSVACEPGSVHPQTKRWIKRTMTMDKETNTIILVGYCEDRSQTQQQ